ncbi:hypothetical protein [Mucilaginibacter phyllosphaerae]
MIISNYSKIISSIVKIQDEVLDASSTIDEATKQALRQLSAVLLTATVNHPKLNAYQFKSITNELLYFWNESISANTEKFWDAIYINTQLINRKDQIKNTLLKGRFKSVEQGISARNNWELLKQTTQIRKRFQLEQINQVSQIIAADEQKRLTVLQKTLTTGYIPKTQYLKFGECMAYFANCLLFKQYFTKVETEELYRIWEDFIYQ